jgi:DNA polymerase type B, organellar and viral
MSTEQAPSRDTVIQQVRPSVITSDISNLIVRRKRPRPFTLPDGTTVARIMFNSNYVDYVVENKNENELIIASFLKSIRGDVTSLLTYELALKLALKCNLFLTVTYVNILEVIMEFGYKTFNLPMVQDDSVDEFISLQYDNLLADVENRQLMNSGWTLFKIRHLEVRCSKYKPIPARIHIKLPPWIVLKRATINYKNDDDFCFKYCIVIHYLRAHNLPINKKNIAEHENKFNFRISFPPNKKQISKFCALNKASINILGVVDKTFYPMRVSKQIQSFHCNLLYYENGNRAHYSLITNLPKLISSQCNAHKARYFFCLRCLLKFTTQQRLDVHTKVCGNEQLATIKLPDKTTFYKFDRFDTCQRAGIIVTLDFESFLVPIQSCTPNTPSFSEDFQRHELASYGIYTHCTVNTPDTQHIPQGYSGKVSGDSVELENSLIKYLDALAKSSIKYFHSNYSINMTSADENDFQAASECYACHKPFTSKIPKVRDHDHGLPLNNYRGACHQSCNLLVRRMKMIPVYCHGLGNYDGHYIVRMFAARKFKIQILPNNLERYLSISIWMHGVEIRFLDSVRLFNASLEAVLDSLPNQFFVQTKLTFPLHLHDLILSKMPFPYVFLSGADSLKHETLPEKEYFKSDLTGADISDEMYTRAQQLWTGLDCKTFADMVAAYQCADTVQLMDAILYFRDLIYTKFGVELTSFLSLPQASITCMLKLSKAEIQVFDSSMEDAYDMTKRSLYGGLVSCNKRYVEAEENVNIEFLDVNGLYSMTMCSFKLPISGYTFVETDSQDWKTIDTEGDYGYMLEVDIVFPQSTHDYLNCFVPVCERKIPPGAKTQRLISDFHPKFNYVLSLQHLQLLLRLGVECPKIHSVLRFKQGSYMKEYIDIVSEMRKHSTDTFSSNLFKGMINFLYGKFTESIEKRRSLFIVTDEKRMEKLVRKGTFKDRYIYNYPDFSMALVELSKGVVLFNRPVIVGTMILSLSKVYMYTMWYDVIKPALGVDCTYLTAMDTDSFLFVCTSPDYMRRLSTITDHLDCSGLDPSHPLYSTKNKKVLGKLKFESDGRKIIAACCVKSKVYSLLFEDDCLKKLKGVQKNFVKKELTFQDYKNCVFDSVKRFALYKAIVSKEHVLFTTTQRKLALECTDCKRFILDDRINTLAYGHYKLQ